MSRSDKPFRKRLNFDESMDMSTSVKDSIDVQSQNLNASAPLNISDLDTFQLSDPLDDSNVSVDVYSTPDNKLKRYLQQIVNKL